LGDVGGPGLLDRAVEVVARAMDALGLNGTRLRWRWSRRRRDLGEAALRGEMIVRSARTPLKMCPECRALVPRAAWTCAECGAGLARVRAPGLSRVVANMIPGATAATGVILLANVVMFAVCALLPVADAEGRTPSIASWLFRGDSATLLRYGMGAGILTFGLGETWRLVTPLFLHAGVLHLLMNSMVLRSLGPLAEEEYGTERFAVVYILSGIGGTLLAQNFGNVATVGASGAICGLLGLLLVHGWRRGGAYGQSLRNAMMQNALLMGVMSFLPGIDWRSHLGGFVAGAFFGLVLPYRAFRSRWTAWLWDALLAILLLGCLFAFYRMAVEGPGSAARLEAYFRSVRGS
jgi:membrane associated rhomboid family serine protease